MKRSVFRWLRQNAEPYFGEAIVRGSEFLRKAGLPENVVEKITDRTLNLAPKILQRIEEAGGKQYYESPHLKKYNPVIIDASPQTTNPTFDIPPPSYVQSYNPTFDTPPRMYLPSTKPTPLSKFEERRQAAIDKIIANERALKTAELMAKKEPPPPVRLVKPPVVRKRATRATAKDKKPSKQTTLTGFIQPVEKVEKKKSIQQVIV